MTHEKPNFKTVMNTIYAKQSPTTHPSDEVLIGYSTGTLPEQQKQEILNHLANCPQCTQELLVLKDFSDTIPDDFQVSPQQLDRDIQKFREHEGLEIARQSKNSLKSKSMSVSYRALLFAASFFFVTTLSLSLLILQGPNQKTPSQQPEANISIADRLPENPRDRGATLSKDILSWSTNEAIILILNPPHHKGYSDYRISIHEMDGQMIWEESGFKPTEYGNFTLGLPANFLRPGNYNIKLFGLSTTDTKLLAVYRNQRVTNVEGE